ncbi:MAG: hypothetical protein ACKOA1_10110 [Bacteroidota bacterium]
MNKKTINFKSDDGIEISISRELFLQHLEQYHADQLNGIESSPDNPKVYDWVKEANYDPSKVEKWMRFMKDKSEIEEAVFSFRDFLKTVASNDKYVEQFIKKDPETFARSRVVMYAWVRSFLSTIVSDKGLAGQLMTMRIADLLTAPINVNDMIEQIDFLTLILPMKLISKDGIIHIQDIFGVESLETVIRRVAVPADKDSIDVKFKDNFIIETLYVVYKCEKDLTESSAYCLTGLIAAWLGVLQQEKDYDGNNTYRRYLQTEVSNVLRRMASKFSPKKVSK